jgi:SAM-dependent methyltransferase
MFLDDLLSRNLWREGTPLRLHLGCGEQRLRDYINVDYEPERHNVMAPVADIFADIVELDILDGTVDEVRLHHVFEHFGRVVALAQLLKWHRWLKLGGVLRIETPNIEGGAKTISSDASYRTKMGHVRHLAGDQAAGWGYHVDHWFPERFRRTLEPLGFEVLRLRETRWENEPFLSNVDVLARKTAELTTDELLDACDRLLWESTVADAERPTFEVWTRQLREVVKAGVRNASRGASSGVLPGGGRLVDDGPPRGLEHLQSDLPLKAIQEFNQSDRDAWVQSRASQLPAGSRVLDVGAGTCPYRMAFAHCEYVAHDFKKYAGVKLGGVPGYGQLDIVSDITALPVEDAVFDAVLCTEVLEHVPEPILALRELARVVRPGGEIIITAPLGSGLHMLPFHYYGGFTPEWYRLFGEQCGLEVIELTENGGFFKLLAQECARVAWTLGDHRQYHGDNARSVGKLFGEYIPRFLFALEERHKNTQFTVGYHVRFRRRFERTAAGGDIGTLSSAKASSGVRAGASVRAIVFSKDRPLQLDATLSSLRNHCRDFEKLDVRVIYKATDDRFRAAYKDVAQAHSVRLIEETDFRADTRAAAAGAEHILFIVDDCLFVREFSADDCVRDMAEHADVLGVSLRLGTNTVECYPVNRTQALPVFTALASGSLAFDWTDAEFDFGYPLEVSSSIFRGCDVLPLLEALPYTSPNTLEELLARNAGQFRATRPKLICFKTSVAFCVPLNRVQSLFANRCSDAVETSPSVLLERFEQNMRVDVERMNGFVPRACHQEVELPIRRAADFGRSEKGTV